MNRNLNEQSPVEKEIKKVRAQIARMANRVSMEVDRRVIDIDIEKEWKHIAPSVDAIECVLNGDDCTVLNVRFDRGGIISKHRHDRQEEIFVVSGRIYDSVNDVTVEEGDRYIIPANTPHQIESDYARLTVVFRPPYPRVETSR